MAEGLQIEMNDREHELRAVLAEERAKLQDILREIRLACSVYCGPGIGGTAPRLAHRVLEIIRIRE